MATCSVCAAAIIHPSIPRLFIPAGESTPKMYCAPCIAGVCTAQFGAFVEAPPPAPIVLSFPEKVAPVTLPIPFIPS